MKPLSSLSVFTIFIITTCSVISLLTENVRAERFCPNKKDIAPCTCHYTFNKCLTLKCSVQEVTQKSIDRAIEGMRRKINGNNNPNGPLNLCSFVLEKTNLVEFNLTSFLSGSVNYIEFKENSQLTKFTGSTSSKLILINNVKQFEIYESPINDSMFASTMKLFSLNAITYFKLYNTQLTGEKSTWELLGGESMPNLEMLILWKNKIKKIPGGVFKNSKNLNWIDLNWNEIEELESDSFLVPQPKENSTRLFHIGLEGNRLGRRGSKISPTAFMTDYNGEYDFNFGSNEFTHFDEGTFKKLVDQKNTPRIWANYNKFICDKKMKWIKDRRGKLEDKWTGLDCENDEGKDVFTTTKI